MTATIVDSVSSTRGTIMQAYIVRTEPSGAAGRSLVGVEQALRDAGVPTRPLRLPESGLPAGTEAVDFKASPPALVESWRVAKHVQAITSPGDVVVMSDRNGIGAVFAWEQAMLSPQNARRLVLVGADSHFLANLALGGTSAGFGLEDVVGLETSTYRFAEHVLATSDWAAAQLEPIARSVQVVTASGPHEGSRHARPPTSVWLPEPVGRSSQARAVLSALANTDARVTVSDRDDEDRFWKGSTWEVLAPVVGRLTGLTRAAEPPPDVDAVILGNMTCMPDEAFRLVRGGDVRILVAAGSAAAAQWPDVEIWEDEHNLVDVLLSSPLPRRTVPPFDLRLPAPAEMIERARRVSVGVPVYRNVAFLDECIESILAQSQAAVELVLYDDGSESEAVTKLLDEWGRREPEVVRVMVGPNQGVCVARNRMLESMIGDAFLLVDSDDRLAPSFIEECAEALRANPDLGAVATWTEFFGDYEGVEAKMPFDTISAWDENPIISTCVLVDMATRDRGVRFSPDLAWIFCEDWEFWAKIVAGGDRFGLIPKPLAFHRAAPASGGGYRRTELAYNVGRARARQFLRVASANELIK